MDRDKIKWKKIYVTDQRYLAEIVRGVLGEHDIEGVVLDKKDSAYGFGEVEVYTAQENVLRAVHIIKSNNL